ncbi:MAG: class I SAM-dependent methyltransferase [Tannerellaceae bacterium]|jgi:hypothetical protein|nr:class I SAM-dependent methyltransferase [Tannerellaceae bacterium]
MNLFATLEKRYSSESRTAPDALRAAHEIAFGPVVFQVSRLMVKFGILQMLLDSEKGMTIEEVAAEAKLSRYAAQTLLESSLTIGIVLYKDDLFEISKTGWFLLNDPLVRVNMDFNHDVNYLGWFRLEEALLNGKPEGLGVFGSWSTIYEGLSSLPEHVQKSWFAFDHYYSDASFSEALEIVLAGKPKRLLDVGGNTGRWAMQCTAYDPNITVTVMDLPQQLKLMRKHIAGSVGQLRIDGHAANLLDNSVAFPSGYDAIWMSQFLDCFSEEEATSILARAAASMSDNSILYIMETCWDRQKFDAAAFCLAQISLYFTAIANGNSKMYHSDDLLRCIQAAGLQAEEIHDGLGKGHSLILCRKTSDAKR